jgi:PAP2 superfamily
VPEHRPPPLSSRFGGAAQDSRRWTVQLWQRMRRYLWLKAIGISLFMWVFFIGYFHLLRNPVFPVTQMPLTALDLAIPFQPGTVIAYLTLWVYVGIPPGLLLSFRQLVVYGLWAAALCLTGLACFYFFPTAVPPLALDPDLARFPAFALLQGVDAAGNACPSLHVATAMFSAIWIDRLLREMSAPNALRVVNGAWFLLIVHSTLATKQHVVLDVVAGVPLGIAFAFAALRWRPREPRL